jgi:hypothetical protein
VRVLAAGAVLVAAFLGALLVGRAGGDSGDDGAASVEVKTIKLPDQSARVVRVEDPGTIPDLQPKPQVTSTPTTGSNSTAGTSTGTSSTPSTGTTTPSSGGGGGGGGGGGSTQPVARPPG